MKNQLFTCFLAICFVMVGKSQQLRQVLERHPWIPQRLDWKYPEQTSELFYFYDDSNFIRINSLESMEALIKRDSINLLFQFPFTIAAGKYTFLENTDAISLRYELLYDSRLKEGQKIPADSIVEKFTSKNSGLSRQFKSGNLGYVQSPKFSRSALNSLKTIAQELIPALYIIQNFKKSPALKMSVAFSNQTIKSGYDIRFFLQIQSWSTRPIRIPQDYELCETPGVGNIKYEAVCLAADSLINLKFRPPLIGPMENTGRMVELRYNERFIFEVGVPIEAFPQKGIYKIRFLTKNIFFDGFEGNLVTDWVFVSVQTNHFAPKFYRKGGVWLSLLLL